MPPKLAPDPDFYAALDIPRSASETDVRRAYRKLITKEHPDKGGDAERFAAIQRAYDVLSNQAQRKMYDATGRAERTADEELMETFGGGKFRDKQRAADDERAGLAEAIIKVASADAQQSHSSGFDAWLRTRGEVKVYTGEDVVEDFGVEASSYEAVPLLNIRAYQAPCAVLGNPADVLELNTEAIPKALQWGEVLVAMRAMPINPADLYAVRTGASPFTPESEALKPPFVAGSDGLAVVMKVGPGVKGLAETDWVLPFRAGMGTWRSLAVWREKDLMKVPVDVMPPEYAAMLREMCVAYRLLEDHGALKPGDSVLLNAATSAVGTCVIQLCRMLKLRALAVIRPAATPDETEKTVARLKAFGAAEVLLEGGSLKAKLEESKFFAKPRLALDAVGGASAAAMADALQDGGTMVIYGCLSGTPPAFQWASWVFRDLHVTGFNLRKWMSANKKRIPMMVDTLAKLVAADKLRLDTVEYELSTEFKEALEHALEGGRNAKVLLLSGDCGVFYQ